MIAYVLPGFIALAGFVPLFPVVGQWLAPVPVGDFGLGLGPPLYAILAATALGQILSCFRWLFVDQAHHLLGVRRPAWDDSRLDRVLGGFDYLVQSHFRYYEFCGNTLLALSWSYGVSRSLGALPFLGPTTDLTMLAVLLVLFTASRNALTNYYDRTSRLVGRPDDETRLESEFMYNGNDHSGTGCQSNSAPEPNPQQQQPKATPKAPAATEPKDKPTSRSVEPHATAE